MADNLQPANPANSPEPATQCGLRELASGISPDVDIVAIHGVSGEREDCWTADNGVLWLRDLLPARIPNARILTYGYDKSVHRQKQLAASFPRKDASDFIVHLAHFREKTATVDRPIIFVAHRSNGLFLEIALIFSHLYYNHPSAKPHRAIYHSTRCLAFFGTPQQGSATAELARPILRIGPFSTPTNNVLQDLQREALHQDLEDWSEINGEFEIIFFCRTHDMDVAGVSKRVVPRTSAVIPGAINGKAIGFYNDHIRMVKLPAADGEDFRTVSSVLSLMSKTAFQKREVRCKSTIKEFILTPSQQRALSKLRPVIAAQFDTVNCPGCLEGTRVDLLRTISEWAEQDIYKPPIFWLCGQAGMGKTAISLTVADDCEMKGRLGASFFFSRDHPARSDPGRLFPSVAHQLGIFHPPFRKSLAKALQRDPDLGYLDPMYQIRELIVDPLKSCRSFPTSTIIVIDALDECGDNDPFSTIISILSAHIHELPNLRFFITSRPEHRIVAAFRIFEPSFQSVILHDIEDSVVDADIELYLRNGFSTTADMHPCLVKVDWPSDESIKSLVRVSGGLFIFAATAMTFIQDDTYGDPPNQLSILLGESPATYSPIPSPFASINRLYLQVLRHAFPELAIPPKRLALLRMVLGTIALLRDPLSVAALARLLRLGCPVVHGILRLLHSVMVVPSTDDPIRFFHPSFLDFAPSRWFDTYLRIEPLVCHEQLAIGCFKQMEGLTRNMCSIQNGSKLNSEIEDLTERIERNIPPAMQYACRHWSFHLCSAGGKTLQGMLGEFCRKHIMYWIEALSLLGCLQEGIRHLQDVLKFLNTHSAPSKDLLEALNDTTRFMVDLFQPISCAALQLYRSALPVSAPSSFLRKAFCHELNGGMRVLQGQRLEKSSSDVTTLHGSPSDIGSVDFSPDERIIVSTSSIDKDKSWDCALSQDGARVISGSDDGTLRVCGSKTIRSPEQVQTVGFSPGNTQYLSGTGITFDTGKANSEEIRHVWDGPTATHFCSLIPITVSPDQKFIAFRPPNANLCLWDIASRSILWTSRLGSPVTGLTAFSSDSTRIVSTSPHTFQIWDAANGDNLFIIHLTSALASAFFSHDGSRIIIEDQTYDIPPPVRPHPVPCLGFKYSIDGEWIFASNGTEKERCVWIP